MSTDIAAQRVLGVTHVVHWDQSYSLVLVATAGDGLQIRRLMQRSRESASVPAPCVKVWVASGITPEWWALCADTERTTPGHRGPLKAAELLLKPHSPQAVRRALDSSQQQQYPFVAIYAA